MAGGSQPQARFLKGLCVNDKVRYLEDGRRVLLLFSFQLGGCPSALVRTSEGVEIVDSFSVRRHKHQVDVSCWEIVDEKGGCAF